MIATTRVHGGLKDHALVLRLDHDMSIRQIALRLGVPRATVGEWVRGHGETNLAGECRLCRAPFFASRSHAKSCSAACRRKYNQAFA